MGISSDIAKKNGYFQKYYKWEVLVLLWVAFFLNQADRQIYNTLLDKISDSLSLTPSQAGLVATLFSLVFAFCVPFSGYLADKFSKKWILCASIFLWSLATIVSGSCAGLFSFIIFRSFATGIGEATFGPANYSTIADYHDESTRSRAMSLHQTSYYLGVIMSGLIAGWIGDRWGWRSAFYIFGAVGVVHALIMVWRLRDKVLKSASRASLLTDFEKSESARQTEVSEMCADQNPAAGGVKKSTSPTFSDSVKTVLSTPTAVALTIGFAGLIFVLQGYLTWSTLFLQEKFSLSNTSAGFNAMFYTHIFALGGILIAGYMADKLAVKAPNYRMLLQSAGLLFACPFIILMGVASELWLVYLGFAGFGFFRAFFDANTYSVLYDVIPRKYHGSSAGIFLFLGWGAGSLSPFVLGVLKPHVGLSTGIAMLAGVWFVCSILMFFAVRQWYMRDYRRARAVEMLDEASA